MAYRGNYFFEDGDMVDESDDIPACRCCGADYCSNDCLEDEQERTLYLLCRNIGYDVERFSLSSSCQCTEREYREFLEDEGVIRLDSYGNRLLERLRDLPSLKHIDEWDICRLSEEAGKTFQELCEWFDQNLVLLHVQAWARYMQKKWG